MKALVGNKVEFAYGLPAISCCMNGRVYRGSGRILRLAKPKEHDFGRKARVFIVNEYAGKHTIVASGEVTKVIS